ncbi:MAG: hypothetical protein MI861_19995 [Pirellulales bacterium]|nr:hypothetical protein [Pirellulales bacterium]
MNKDGKVVLGWVRPKLILWPLLPLLFGAGGCRICADCEDLAYPAYGGAWERTLRETGRVGSVFDPAGARRSELVSRDDPPRQDVIERSRQGQQDDSPDGSYPGGLQPPEPEDAADQGEAMSDEQRFKMRAEELRGRSLEDIETEREEDLRNRQLDDLNLRIIPGRAEPPSLQET